MPTYSDFAYYDTTAPARDVLISLAEKYDVPVSYLNNSVITRSEIRSIYLAEQAAVQLALENFELTFDEWDELAFSVIPSKYGALLKKLQDVKRASFRDIFTKAAVEEIVCSLSYETSYGKHNVYQIWPFEVKLRGGKGDLYYARDVADSITKSFLLLGFLDLTFKFSGGNLVHFSSPYSLPTSMQNRYDSYSLSDLVVSERDLIVFAPPGSTLGEFPYILDTGAATYTFNDAFEFIASVNLTFEQLVNTVTNFGLVGQGGVENPVSYLNAVQDAYNTYEFFATAYNSYMADKPAWGHYDIGYDVWDAIRSYASFLNSIASINNHQFFCAMLDHFIDPYLNIWNGYPINTPWGSPPHYWQFIDSLGFNAAYNRQWIFANDPQHVILGFEALFRSVGYFDII